MASGNLATSVDLTNNSELLRYANSTSDEPEDVNEDSFFVVEREILSGSPPRGNSVNSEVPAVPCSSGDLMKEIDEASRTTPECHISDVPPGGIESVVPSSVLLDPENYSVEIDRLKEENIILQDEVKKQNGKMREVMEQYRQMSLDAQRLREEDQTRYEHSRVRILELEKENQELKERLEAQEVQLTELQEKLNALESKAKDDEFVAVVEDNKEEQLTRAKRQLEDMQELLTLEKTQTTELKERLRAIQSAAPPPTSASIPSDPPQGTPEDKQSIIELNKKLVENDEEIQTLRAQLESSLMELDNLKQQTETLTYAKEALHAQNIGTHQQIQFLQHRIPDLEAQLAEMTLAKAKLEEIASNYKEQIQVLQTSGSSSSEELKNQLLGRDDQIQTLEVRLESLQIALDEVRKNADTIYKENSDLKTTREGLIQEIENFHVERAAKRMAQEEILAQSTAKLEAGMAAKQEVEELRMENRQLNQKLRDRDVSFQEISIARQKLEDICAKYKEKNQKLSEEAQNLKLAQSAGKREESSSSAPSSLGADEAGRIKILVEKLDRENAVLKTQIAALTTENESIDHWKAQCELYTAEYQTAVSDRAALEAQLAEMRAQLEELQAKEAEQQKELSDLHNTHLRLAQEHVNGEPDGKPMIRNARAAAAGKKDKNDDDIFGQMFHQFKRGVSSLLWDDSSEPAAPANVPASDATSAAANSSPSSSVESSFSQSIQPSSPPASAVFPTNNSASDSADLPPCPVCARVFYSYDNLVRHCETCGENGSVISQTYGSHLDPFVFVPQQ